MKAPPINQRGKFISRVSHFVVVITEADYFVSSTCIYNSQGLQGHCGRSNVV